MIKKIANIGLKEKFLLITSIIIFVALGIPSAILYQYYYKTFSPMINESFELMVYNSADRFNKVVENVEKAVDAIHNNEEARFSSSTSSLTTVADAIINFEISEDTSNVKEELERYQTAVEYFTGMIELACGKETDGYQGQLIIFEEYPIANYLINWNVNKTAVVSEFVAASDLEQEVWYQKTLEKAGDYYWFVQEEQPEMLFVAKLLTYQQLIRGYKMQEKELGILLIAIDIGMLQEEMSLKSDSFEGQGFITYEGNILFELNNKEFHMSNSEMQELFDDVEVGASVRKFYNCRSYFVQRNELLQGMNLCTMIPVYHIQIMEAKVAVICIVVILGISCMVWIALRILNYYFVKPIVNLSNKMKKRELDYKEDEGIIDRTDEIGVLYREYIAMQEKNQELIQQVWKGAREKRKKEIMALQMQINPHFVFNTLGTLSCYALMKGQDDIAKQLSSISVIMRYYTRNPEKIVPLREEILMIKQYQEIQQMTHKDSIIFKYCIDRECEDFMIPKLIIQPLVENAILYGAPKDDREHEIEISVALFRENELMIVVRDSGRDADVEWINQYISGKCEKE